MDEFELYHHGIKGQKWGVRRFQNPDGSLTARGKKRLGLGGYIKAKKAEAAKKKAAAEKQKAAEAKRKEEEAKKKEAEDIDAKKAKILKSRSAKDLYENADLFTTNELQSAYNRLNLERNIANLSPADTTAGKTFSDKFVENAGKLSNMVDSGGKLYNNVAKVYNTFWGNKNGKAIPLISDKVASKLDKMKAETDRLNTESAYKEAVKKATGWKTETDRINDETKDINAKVANAKAKERAYEYAKEFSEKYGYTPPKNTGPIDVTDYGSDRTSTVSNDVVVRGQNEVARLLKAWED